MALSGGLLKIRGSLVTTMSIDGDGEYDLEVVGESYYQDALVRIAGPHTEDGRRVKVSAVLYLEPDNPHDRNAIRVEINGATVGHVSRELAPELRKELISQGARSGHRIGVDAIIVGGRIGESYGVWLDVPMDDDDDYDDEEEDDDDIEIKVEVVAAPAPVAREYSPPRLPTGPAEPVTYQKQSGFPWWGWALIVFAALIFAVLFLAPR